ncbi:Hypothetical protein PHPALM_735 [Phytophthora palmivora]|uniref:Uncharacterized protein n=1 Tax=Phytophthora palmivora TaxID=4796 RepID=A0A2P4YU38_9STRA|nr:Hypothetical protein PHPALM_735 [Phytophthora palmivora]
MEDDTLYTASLIEVAHKRASPNEPCDLRRLFAVVSFHNAESVMHNTHCHFAPSRQAPNSRLMPKIWLDEVLALPRRTRIEVVVLIATFLQFRFPKTLLSEALAIRQLDSPQFPSEAIRDIVNLPPYALVALIAIARHVSLDMERSMREKHKPEVATPEFEDESKLLGAIPPLFTTLLSTRSGFANPVDDSDPHSMRLRWKREAIFRELMPLIRAAEPDPDVPSGREKPKLGDWVEVYAKQFLKIHFVSADELFVVAISPTDSTQSITLSLEQLLRTSSSVWRVKNLTKRQVDELSANVQHKKSDTITTNNTRVGKLHRDNEGFHRHGAARNQGFPNYFVTPQLLEQLDSDRNNLSRSSSHTKSIEVFSSNDTLDANYVLTSPDHISAQNYCAISTFLQQRQVPRGLWSPVHSAQYSILPTPATPMIKSSSLSELKTKPRTQQKVAAESQPQQSDDWLEIKRAMQLQLGFTHKETSSSEPILQTGDVSSVMTTPERDVEVKSIEVPSERRRMKTPQLNAKLSTVHWHQVATKTQLVVAAPVMLPSISQKSK